MYSFEYHKIILEILVTVAMKISARGSKIRAIERSVGLIVKRLNSRSIDLFLIIRVREEVKAVMAVNISRVAVTESSLKII
jgi:hypothetical protein